MLLLTSKMTYAPLVLTGVAYFCYKKVELKKLFLGLLIVLIPFLVNQKIQYGEIFYFGAYFSRNVATYNWLNFVTTLRQGYFGEGGLFYSNPVFLLAIIFFSRYIYQKVRRSEFGIVEFILTSWLGLGLFQTLFITGPVFEDHLVGRIFLTTLPVLVFGFALTIEKFSSRLSFKAVSSLVLLFWQTYVTFSYMAISRIGHYKYAEQKQVGWNVVSEFLRTLLHSNFDAFSKNVFFVVSFALLITGLCILLVKSKILFLMIYKRLILASVVLLCAYCVGNFIAGTRLMKDVESDPLAYQNKVIGLNPDAYMFVYVLDIFETQYRNSKSEEMKTLIERKRNDYFLRVKNKFEQKNSEFEKMLND
ncbi:hypothetical protein, partial [Bacteriovorax sp. DB6_IX]|uniref:hypothetical protein n=1 Tax=Bacteriovorax sp. DB6_IX TaxID=1353530 RepID=UPI00038A39FE